jgi:hypothetical protein
VFIHNPKFKVQVVPKIAVSYNAKTDRKNEVTIAKVESRQAPKIPIKRPKQIQERKLKNGIIKIQKYIENKKICCLFLHRTTKRVKL